MVLGEARRDRAFSEALNFREFVDSMQVNRDIFEANFQAFALDEAEQAFFKALPTPLEVLVLAHDWCGDVVSNLPLLAKIEATTDKLHLHILLRDPANIDIAELYLHPADGSNHIPTYIFFTQHGQNFLELGVFIERPAAITALIAEWRSTFEVANPTATPQEWQVYYRQRRNEARPVEQAVIIATIKQLVQV
jgi:hypothetical protein